VPLIKCMLGPSGQCPHGCSGSTSSSHYHSNPKANGTTGGAAGPSGGQPPSALDPAAAEAAAKGSPHEKALEQWGRWVSEKVRQERGVLVVL
jgi:hypothetical protein